MQQILPALAVLIAGAGLALQAPANARLAQASGSVLLASLISFAVGTLALLAIWLALDRDGPLRLAATPHWAWLGGVYGAAYVAAMAYAAPRLGMAGALTVAIAGQLLIALVIDQFGLFGQAQTPVSPARAAGAALVVAGVLLVRRG